MVEEVSISIEVLDNGTHFTHCTDLMVSSAYKWDQWQFDTYYHYYHYYHVLPEMPTQSVSLDDMISLLNSILHLRMQYWWYFYL